MNENLNLMDILKDCPKGTKLYSTVHGEVEFEKIINDDTFPIKFSFKVKGKNSDLIYAASVSIDGKYATKYNGECILFPSKDQRDWSKFNTELEMVDGEFYYCVYGGAKENSCIFIYKKQLLYKTKSYVALSLLYSVVFKDSLITNNNENITELRKATEAEKQQLLNAIKRDGYKWNEEKKELTELNFDINTLKPFDKILVKDITGWYATTFSHYKNCLVYSGDGKYWTQNVVPYNEETKHLVGTCNTPPKKYITWRG